MKAPTLLGFHTFITVAALLAWLSAPSCPAQSPDFPALGDGDAAVYEFSNRDFDVAYLDFKNHVRTSDEFVTIGGPDTRDKGGALVNGTMNFASFENATPFIVVRPGESNAAEVVRVQIRDSGGTVGMFSFSLKNLPSGSFTRVYEMEGATLANPGSVNNEKNPEDLDLDASQITQFQFQGAFQGKTVHLDLRGIYLAKNPPEDVLKIRAAATAKRKAESERERLKREETERRVNELLSGTCQHPADGARVIHIAPAGLNLLAVELQCREYQPGKLEPYTAQPGDLLKDGKEEWIARGGKLVRETVGQSVFRKDGDGSESKLGAISFDGKWVLVPDSLTGTPLETVAMDFPKAYVIDSADDPAFKDGVTPTQVHRKSKPNSPKIDEQLAVRHVVYLKMPHPLKDGATYRIQFKALNTRDATVNYTHDPRSVRSEAIHASHVGYHPDSPFKRAYFSVWLGTGGGIALPDNTPFELIDANSGKTVYSGTAIVGKALGAPEQLKEEKDYAKTAVYWLDFSDFQIPGTYKIFVPEIGTSYPFELADTVWEGPLRASLKALVTQRNGIALGPPFSDFQRPRTYHPDDGVKFYQIDISVRTGQEGARGDRLVELWNQTGSLEEVKGIWGGYQDAGDWDVYHTSLRVSQLLGEAFEINQPFATNLKLVLPGDESKNRIPDLLDEALWGVSAFKRLQRPDGAVREGYGDGWVARNGDLSWNNSNPVCVYAPTREFNYSYAAVAAKIARLLAPYNAAQAEDFAKSARLAWDWAEKQDGAAVGKSDRERAFAAAELYWLTSDQAFHTAFKECTELTEPVPDSYAGGLVEPMGQNDANFTYARLPDSLADAELKASAIKRFRFAGQIATHFMRHNAFNIVTAYPGLPVGEFIGYFTSPGGIINIDVVRASHLAPGDETLAAVVASTNFSLGANPENMAMTTGIGPNPVLHPLKLDSRRSGQPHPAGITVYGSSDQTQSQSHWVHSYFIGKPTEPNSRSWPAQESYFDIFTWPGTNEYTVERPMSFAVYTWCYLAAQAAAANQE